MLFLGYIFIATGLLAIITTCVGCYRFPDYFCKMHASAIGDILGCPLILFGIAILSNQPLKIIFLAIILLFANPGSCYFLNLFAKEYFKRKNADR